MGSLSAMKSLERVLERHGAELEREAQPAPPGTRLVYVGTVLENSLYAISVEHEFRTEAGEPVFIEGQPFDIDALAERFPDCEVGY